MLPLVRYKKVEDCKNTDLKALVSPVRIEKASRFKHEADFNRSVCAEILLNEMAKELFPGIKTPLTLTYDEKGKPHCKKQDGLPLHFSLSHSGDFVACIISDRPCGIDIERIREKDITTLADRVLTPAERQKITVWEFYETWTVKESVLKALGTGLLLDMRLISVERDGTNVTAEAALDGSKILKGEILPAPEGYCLSYVELQ
ncbi:MAG: 4'-phosphopantetheinyl transferase superfamily protein [Lachnospiraceae bacterium]|nr:4'-phosphopantetheinyl transferase superfamily protein [Lachnospiraceae bacterium]